ncbi:polyprenol phosphomannose-dependent alpha 1,6 mannosyltransferase MptB [Specibacter cremeus]|uniref:polyprenol phosphomannose-dependent alpha 1,6 mannosyltransferase MptB n=1 Tax=Specibacter cremeus TaxID=1629051 RepID=UPI00197BCF05|nr:polyprenol phosphomannose-dependent alpha 1,6 mannosyltransferase MptB [Specibacter cremeus]
MTPASPGAPAPAPPAATRAWVAILQGGVGSALMFVGSLGIGWIAVASPMVRNRLVIALRAEGVGVTVSTILLTVGALLLIRSWLRLGQRLAAWGPGSLRAVVTAICAWSVPLFIAVPIFSRDVYAYTGQGRLMAEGMNPYTTGISALNNWFALGADPSWAENRTPYGPLFLWLARGVVGLTGAQPDVSVLLFRAVAGAGVALCVVYIPKLAALHGVNGARALWIAAANPLFLISFVASAHNDALMLGLAVAGTYFAATRKPLWGIALVTASIAVKPITVLLLPFIGLLWAGSAAGWGRKAWCWAGTAGFSLALLLLAGLPYGLGLGWTWALLDGTPGYTGYAPSGFGGQLLELAGNAVGLDGAVVGDVFRKVLQAAAVAWAGWLVLRGDPQRVVRRLGLAFAVVVLFSPIIQPWYVLWFIPFLAATGIRDNWQIKSVYVAVSFFVVFGAQDQLSVWNFVSLPVDVSRLAFWVALAGTLYLLVADVHTRRLLFAREPAAPPLPPPLPPR